VPRFEPFAGLRYDPATVGGPDLSRVVAPPYDVIDPPQREALAGRSPWNAVRVELPEGGPDPYREAARLLSDWVDRGVLRTDTRPGFYLYRMSFTDHAGQARTTRGVIGALEVSRPGEGDVLLHERTTPKAKTDRLELLRACRTNTSPVWGLSLAGGLSAHCQGDGAPAATATDDQGVLHELWVVSDLERIGAIASSVGSAPVVIADGHHRYETALAYSEERRVDRSGAPGDYDLVMALVVELTEDELAVGPIHRLLTGLPEGLDLEGALRARFDLEPAPIRAADPPDPPTLARLLTGAGAPALVTAERSWYLLAHPETATRAGDDLDTARLDVALGDLPGGEVSFHHDPAVVLGAVAGGQADAAVLVRPPSVAAIASAARERRRMPPKTTFFTPKPRTGMVWRPVTD